MNDELKCLINQMKEILESSRNLANKSFWESQIWPRDMWRGFPKFKPFQGIPFLVFPDNALWARILKVDLRDYYSNPEVHLKTQLRMNICHFSHSKDNTYYTKDLFIWFGVVTELSFFGPKIIFFPNREGWIESPPLLEKKGDLGSLKRPDFYKNGLMPKIHEFYEERNELVNGKFRVLFPNVGQGPFLYCCPLKGAGEYHNGYA